MIKENRIYSLLYETTQLNEYQLGQKNDLVSMINKLVIVTSQTPNPKEFDKKLNTILEFYRYYQNGAPLEDTIVYQEFKNKLLKLAKDNKIDLK
jgi:hypothetical protein